MQKEFLVQGTVSQCGALIDAAWRGTEPTVLLHSRETVAWETGSRRAAMA